MDVDVDVHLDENPDAHLDLDGKFKEWRSTTHIDVPRVQSSHMLASWRADMAATSCGHVVCKRFLHTPHRVLHNANQELEPNGQHLHPLDQASSGPPCIGRR